MTVLEQVVEKSWCIGCGVCVALCPQKRLEMRWNDRAEYSPVAIEGGRVCGTTCSLCFDICPAHGQTKNETEIGLELYAEVPEIQHTPETGYWLGSYVGYSKEHRLSSASGGIATWALEKLLGNGEVDAVLAVGRTADPDKLFEFKVCETVEQVRECSRSAYYPVETSRVLQHVLEHEGCYAIIGLPCVCKAIRLAQGKFPKLKQRLKYVLGLTCGHTCSKYFAEYICALGGGDPHQLETFTFRTKDLSQPASNLGMHFLAGQGVEQISRQVLWRDGVGSAFTNGYFQLQGCFHCDDIFAECADAVFMDAWLPEYAKKPEGHSIVLSRCIESDRLLTFGVKQEELSINRLSIDQTIKSQKGVIERKRRRLVSKGEPQKRVALFRRSNALQSKRASLMRACGFSSAQKWIEADKNFERFTRSMGPLQKKLNRLQKISRIASIAKRSASNFKCAGIRNLFFK